MQPTCKTYVLIGMLGLVFGSLIYLTDRPPEHTYFVFSSGMDISLYGTIPNLFGLIGNRLPSFLHVFSFILITAGLFARNRSEYLIICISWLLIDCAFELGQIFDVRSFTYRGHATGTICSYDYTTTVILGTSLPVDENDAFHYEDDTLQIHGEFIDQDSVLVDVSWSEYDPNCDATKSGSAVCNADHHEPGKCVSPQEIFSR